VRSDDTPAEAALRATVRAWMEEHVLDSDGLLEGGDPGARGHDGYGRLQDMFLGRWSSRIGGGTEQIQRNLIAERARGLPRDQRTG
jgi:hypothetical protein